MIDAKTVRRRALWRVVVFFLIVLAGCGGNGDALPELEAEEILRLSAEKMQSLEGFHFAIDRDGALAYLDSTQTLAFGSGEGDYVAPDRARAEVSIIAPGFVTRVSVISVGAIQWETNVVTGVWTELPPDWGFNPTVIFDPNIGLQQILINDTFDIIQSEPERIDDGPNKQLYAVSGSLRGENLHQMSGFLIGPDDLTFQAWVDPETLEAVRVIVIDPTTDGDEAIWQVDFSEFGQIVEIEPPELE